jgi:hypothetical protein
VVVVERHDLVERHWHRVVPAGKEQAGSLGQERSEDVA